MTKRWIAWLALPLFAAPGCGDNGRAMHPDASSLFTCTTNAQCDDHITCTVDNCDVSGTCQHTGVDSMCTAPARCVVGTGCSTTMMCTDATGCDDAVACTLDTCNVGGVCGHQPINSMCTAPTPVCNATMGCVAGTPPGCTSAADCNDSIDCTVDACGADMTCHHTTVDSSCPMGQACDARMGCVAHHSCTTAADCTPAGQTWWNFCDGDPNCDPEFGCNFPTPRACHDTDACTLDSCDRTMGANGACVFSCDASRPECNCPTAGPTCAGHFQLTPAPMGRCGSPWNLSTIQVDNADGVLTVHGVQISRPNVALQTDPATTSCPSFTATHVVNGGCEEHYTLTGTFTDENTLNGTFTVTFVQTDGLSCDLAGGCYGPYTYTFTGMRIP